MNQRHNPDTIAAPAGPYSHGVEVPPGSRLLYGLVTVWFRSPVFHYATLASKAKGLMPPRYECRLRAL